MANSRLCSIPDCGKPRFGHGWCYMHYNRWRGHGDPLAGGTFKGEPARFARQVLEAEGSDECVVWPYSGGSNGYAQATIDGKRQLVHRWMCKQIHGDPPSASHQAAHSCGNDKCINGRHLSWKTIAENSLDRVTHGTMIRGENHYGSKLTEDDVRAIRALRGKETQAAIAARYGITDKNVSYIHLRKSWSWLSDDKPSLITR